jgi:hypothetical protein
MYLERYSQAEIARTLSVGQATVSRDLEAMRREWMADKDTAIDLVITRELASIDKLERECWQAWQQSRKQRRIDTVKSIEGGGKDKGKKEAAIRTEDRDGNPEFPRVIERLKRLRGEILDYLAANMGIGDEPPVPEVEDSRPVKVVEDANWFGTRRMPIAGTDGASAPDPRRPGQV